MYDIFYLGKETGQWRKIKAQFPLAIRLENLSFKDISNRVLTKMFWVIWDDVVVNDDFNIKEFEVPPWDRKYIHVFRNGFYNHRIAGICLFPKNIEVSNKEFHHRYFIEKKEIDIEACCPRTYDRFIISSYDDYINAATSATTEMFWTQWKDTEVLDEYVFELFFDPDNGIYDFDRNITHIFKNRCGSEEVFKNGLMLNVTNNPLSKKEINNRFPVDKKEHNVVATISRYPKYTIDTYEDYSNALKNASQEMFWVTWPEIEIIDNTVFDLYFDPDNGVYDFDRKINHVFQHEFRNDKTYNGVMLMSTHSPLSAKEIEFRFLIEKKEHERLVSKHKPYDIIFISYNEPHADENFKKLQDRFPRAKRVHGVKGIHSAHIAAAQLSNTDMFWVVDGDAIIDDNFNFDYQVTRYERDIVCVWHSKNPINNLIYGYGGVKLLPKELTLNMDVTTADMTTSISKRFKSISEVSNITAFSTDPFNTWKSAFRECVKLSSKVIAGQVDNETETRLDVWCTIGKENQFGEYAILGATEGRIYGSRHKNNPKALAKINDFSWLETQFSISTLRKLKE